MDNPVKGKQISASTPRKTNPVDYPLPANHLRTMLDSLLLPNQSVIHSHLPIRYLLPSPLITEKAASEKETHIGHHFSFPPPFV